MTLVCAQCSRVNPEEAAYCYHDGASLAGRSGGPVNASSAPFPNQFVFPNGTACRNFDQFALACQQNWSAAVDLLQKGFLGSFFGGMGRVDLAAAAQEAAKFPDIERGLDQLLAKLPTQALQAPKLQAEPSDINLGQLKIGQDRATELHLTNLGMRLLYGNITTDCKWLTIGEAPGQPEKIFQFGSESILPIQVRGQHLRAGSKPLEGHLIIDSNGGTATVTIKADVPITPFVGGLFHGAGTPRQIAEKAKATPKEAAPFFEGGAIAKWYASNGWNYPVQGPTMSGMGAIQQFFEALGVAKAPKIDLSVKTLEVQGAVGQTVQTSIDVVTSERKVVYGWATCDQPWVEIGKTKLTGKNATIPITIRIPSPCPPRLEAKLNIVGNGSQKMVVPLKVTVAGGKKGVVLEKEEIVPVELIEEQPVALELPTRAKSTPMPSSSSVAVQAPSMPMAVAAAPMQMIEPADDDNPFAITGPPGAVASTPYDATPKAVPATTAPVKPPVNLPLPVRLVLLLLPLAVLGTCLLSLVVRDLLPPNWGGPAVRKADAGTSTGSDDFAEAGKVDADHPQVKLVFDEGTDDKKTYTDSMTFAVHKIDPSKPTDTKRLNWYENGFGNSTVVRIDGKDAVFGKPDTGGGGWPKGNDKGAPAGKFPGGKTRTYEFLSGIAITQTVTIVPGDPVLVGKEYVRPLNTCLAKYKIHNGDKKAHKVGLRVLLDTCIGDNDGAPFTLPGEKALIDTAKEFKGDKVPDFVQVLENPDLSNPGTVVQLTLRVSDKLEMPNRFLLTRYPVSVNNDKKSLDKWDVKLEDIKGDSSVVMYWEEKELKAGADRIVAFSYGLGSVSASSGAKIALTVGGGMYVGGELTVVALVADEKAKTATLQLPAGLKKIDELTQAVGPAGKDAKGKLLPVPVTWRVHADNSGSYDIQVSTETGLVQTRRVTITQKSLFN